MRSSRSRLAILVLLGSIGAFCASQLHAHALEENWQTVIERNHPLVGRIWDVAAGAFIERRLLIERLSQTRFVLLGERHDHPDHHRLQAWVLRALIAAGRRPAVGFEMFTIDDAPAIARHLAAHPTDAAGLAQAVDWQRSGWPDWAMYQPIAEAALQAGLPIVATNLPPATVRAIGQNGLAALDPAFVKRFGLDRPPEPAIYTTMAQDIREAHCGYAPEARLEAMILVQRARDAQMAERLAAFGQQDGAVLIAGAGHVRRDYGVPTYLTEGGAGAPALSLAFIEVSRQALQPTDYAARFHRQSLPFDYVWFTPRVDDQDPCAAFQKQLEKLRKQG